MTTKTVKAGTLDRIAARDVAKGQQIPTLTKGSKAAPGKPRKTTKAELVTAVAPSAPVAKVDRSQKHTYPAPDAVLAIVAEPPKGLGTDQRKRLDYVTKAAEEAKKGKVPLTAGYIAKHCPDGRRTLRRAWRAGVLVLAG